MYTGSGFRSTDFSRLLALSSVFLISSIVSISAYSVSFELGDWSASVDTILYESTFTPAQNLLTNTYAGWHVANVKIAPEIQIL